MASLLQHPGIESWRHKPEPLVRILMVDQDGLFDSGAPGQVKCKTYPKSAVALLPVWFGEHR
jgi:hypothetical protein